MPRDAQPIDLMEPKSQSVFTVQRRHGCLRWQQALTVVGQHRTCKPLRRLSFEVMLDF